MLCVKPFRTRVGEFGCGQCMPCRVNRRRVLTGRIMLESQCHAHNAFVTLTYKDSPWELSPEDLRLFLGRLRYFYPAPFRYYAVGEYGEKNFRPHFHLALFGMSFLDGEYVQKAWSKDGVPIGFVHMGDLTTDSAQYVAGYVSKKMTAGDDPRLGGRYPEFARSSRRPGIGALAVPALVEALKASVGDDVPNEFRMDGRKWPMGRYLKGKIREGLGRDPLVPQVVRQKMLLDFQSEDPVVRERRRESGYNTALSRSKIARSKKVL